MSAHDFLSFSDDVPPFSSSHGIFPSPADPLDPLAPDFDMLPASSALPLELADTQHSGPAPGPSCLVPWPADYIQFSALRANAWQHPSPLLEPATQSDLAFALICRDRSIQLNPRHLGFVPAHSWQGDDITFGDLVTDFFRKKSNAGNRFIHKLFNALKVVETDHKFAAVVGVQWVSEKVLRVHKRSFARLLGIKTIDGSLFHQQGNFPSHGFAELSAREARIDLPVEALIGVDGDEVRLLVHTPRVFVRQCPESAIDACKWVSLRFRGAQ
jgi:hypothetical protein